MALFFFFQAEDGIRDHCVTGVQTCALPIFECLRSHCNIRALGKNAHAATVDERRHIFARPGSRQTTRSEEHTSELQSHSDLVCRLLLEKKKKNKKKQRKSKSQQKNTDTNKT